MNRITKSDIKEKYDLDKERRDIEVTLFKGTLDLNFDEPMTKQEFREYIDSTLSRYPDNTLFQYSEGDWDNQDEIQAIEVVMLPEDDRDVIARLLKKERIDNTKEQDIERAKKLLEDHSFNVSKN